MTAPDRLSAPRFLLIGLGNIGRYVYPCYSSVLGERLARDLLAVKATDAGVEELRARYPFAIRTDGDCAAAAAEIGPDVILLACRPHQVQPLVEEQLRPYFDRCREEGRPLPLIVSYAPAPAVTWFREALGEGVLAANVIPNMVDYTAGICTASITHNMVTLDPAVTWPEAELAFLKRYLAPQGLYLPCRVEETIPLMCAKVVSHRLYDICTALAEGCTAGGQALTHNQAAEAGRAYLRARFDTFEPDIWHCSVAVLPKPLRPLVEAVLRAWYDGIIQVCFEHGLDSFVSGRFLRGMFDLHLLTVSLVDRAQLIRNTKDHTTPGGVQEHSCRAFAAGPEAELREAARRFAAGEPDPDFPARWQREAARLTEELIAFSRDVDRHKG